MDVFAAFTQEDSSMCEFFAEKIPGTKWLADLPGLARRRLQQAGVSSVELSGYCTYGEEAHFYSYRRNRDIGRMATLAWLST
jgi:copper oxidase (laccase) domain-containing protein